MARLVRAGAVGLLAGGVVAALGWGSDDPPAGAKGKGGKAAASVRAAAPPKTWKEHWFEHEQTVRLMTFDDEVAVYFDDRMPKEETDWIAPTMRQVWQYTRKTYGAFGDPKGRLFVLCHSGRYGGGHPSTYFDASHDRRNVIDCGTSDWSKSALDLLTHEVGHIVEGASRGVHESPGFDIWHDSKWIELYQYDLYVGLGFRKEAERVFAKFSAQTDDFPRSGTHWFRDFFFPAWRDNGRAKFMVKFFQLLAEHFPQEREGDHPRYTRKLNWGEFLHFTSAAAGRDLRPLAKKAFGWPDEWTRQFEQAQADFPALAYAPAAQTGSAGIGDAQAKP